MTKQGSDTRERESSDTRERESGVTGALEELVVALWSAKIEDLAALFGVSREEAAQRQTTQLLSAGTGRQVHPEVIRQIERIMERTVQSSLTSPA